MICILWIQLCAIIGISKFLPQDGKKTFFSWGKTFPAKIVFFSAKTGFATSWQKKTHNQKYFRNYKTSRT